MDTIALRFWGGIALIALSALVLFSSLVLQTQLTALLLVAVVAGLAAGSLLVGLSRRGRTI